MCIRDRGKAGASRNATLSQGMTYAESHGLLTGSAVTASSADYALTLSLIHI